MALEYLYQEGVKPEHMKEIKVKLDGKICGSIKPTSGGFHYIPKGKNKNYAGETFKTIGEVQNSLNDF